MADDRGEFIRWRFGEGLSVYEAALRVGRSKSWGEGVAKDFEVDGRGVGGSAGVFGRDELSSVALDCLEDFGRFRARFFGRRSVSWAVEAADGVRGLLESGVREFAVVNAPPGAGKSTLFSTDIPAWLTCRDRAIRGLLGSATAVNANSFCGQLRSGFERSVPVAASGVELERGWAVDAESTLVADYGRFRPAGSGGMWRREMFQVAQVDGSGADVKEMSWRAFGADTEELSWRVGFIVWDDLVTSKTMRTEASRARLVRDWDVMYETRLEPAGFCLLLGQRIGANDLFRHVLDKVTVELDEFGDSVGERKMFHHIVFPAHDEGVCAGEGRNPDHVVGARELGAGGCLLDPVRLPWKDVVAKRRADPDLFECLYQQKDVAAGSALASHLSVFGGHDSVSGVFYLGCTNSERGLREVPEGLDGGVLSIGTVDPSGTNWWAVQWWLFDPVSGRWWLMDAVRRRMTANELLDHNHSTDVFSGVMEDVQQVSKVAGRPISHWVVEQNGAQRYLMAYNFSKLWRRRRGVQIIGHETHQNKLDAEMGVWGALHGLFEHGLIDLPWKDEEARIVSKFLTTEAMSYPNSATTDQVMAFWFAAFWAPKLRKVAPEDMPRLNQQLPDWLVGKGTVMASTLKGRMRDAAIAATSSRAAS